MIKRFEVNLPLVNGEMEKRTAYIYLPESYEKEPHEYYPVLYMFDGHNVFFDSDATFGKSWGMQEYMDKTNTQMIIAAVECNHSPNHGRLEEYSPFTFRISDVGFVPGRGKATIDWYVDVFKRGIDKNYRTLPDREHTFIAGSSMGGLMSIYALMEYNHVYSRAAAGLYARRHYLSQVPQYVCHHSQAGLFLGSCHFRMFLFPRLRSSAGLLRIQTAPAAVYPVPPQVETSLTQ